MADCHDESGERGKSKFSPLFENWPDNTSGLAVEPWSKGELYAVSANWSKATSPIFAYADGEWRDTGRQVASFKHDKYDALAAEIRESMSASGEVDEDEIALIVANAVEIEPVQPGDRDTR